VDAHLRQTVVYFGTVVLGQGLSFLLLPIVTRLLTAEAYGEYAVALAVSSFVGMVATAWVRNVGLRLYYEAEARGSSRGFYLGTALLQAGLLVVAYTGALLALAASGVELAPTRVLVSAGVNLLFGDQFTYAVTLLRAQQRTAPFAVAEIGAGVLRFVATVGGLAAGITTAAMLFDGATVGYVAGAAFAVARLWPRLVGPARLDGVSLRELGRIGPASLPFTVAGWLERLADRLVLQQVLGTAVVGVYSAGYMLGERLIGSLIQAVFMMAWPRVLAAWRDGGTEAARGAIREAQALFAWLTIGPALFLMAFGGTLTRWVTGPDYHDAAEIVPIVVAAMWLGGFGSYLNRHLELHKRFATLSGISLAGALLNLALNLLLIPRFGMLGAASATLANYVFNAAAFYLTRDRALTGIHLAPLLQAGGLAAASWLAAWAVPGGDVPAMVTFVVVYAIGAGAVLVRRR
jgi:O-antigen/teichoic acid export membrane protein